jgi:hypothetical protein
MLKNSSFEMEWVISMGTDVLMPSLPIFLGDGVERTIDVDCAYGWHYKADAKSRADLLGVKCVIRRRCSFYTVPAGEKIPPSSTN